MNISDEIKQKLSLGVVEEPSTHVQGEFQRFDDGSAEIEVLEFLYSLVRLIKPLEVLETGSYLGLSGAYLGSGLRDNGSGHMDSIEWTEQRLEESKRKWDILGIADYISPHFTSSLEFKTKKKYELMLLDTEPQTRFQELDKFWENLTPGGIVVIHDLAWDMGTGSDHWHNLDLIEKRVKSHQLTVMHFYTPRGLTLMRKVNTTVDKPDYIYKILT